MSSNQIDVVFNQEINSDIVLRNSWIPNFNSRKINERWFLSNLANQWCILDDAEYNGLLSIAIPKNLYERLEKLNLILTENNSKKYYEAYKQWTATHYRHLFCHLIVPTTRCNLSCEYCHVAVKPANASKAYDLTIETGKEIVEFASLSPAKRQIFQFQGGEALLNGKVLRELIPFIKDKYAKTNRVAEFSIQTNGTLLSKSWMDFFKNYNIKVGTSLDGPEELHDGQRPFNNGASSHKIIDEKRRRYGIAILPTITKKSLDHWKEIIDLQLERPTQEICFQPVHPINSAAKMWDSVGLDNEKFLSIYGKVVDYLRSLWRDGYHPMDRKFVMAAAKLINQKDNNFADFGNPNGMVHTQIAYNYNGDIYASDEGRDFLEFKIGNVRQSSYDDVILGEKTRRLKSLSIPHDKECKTCAYRAVCTVDPIYERAVNGKLRDQRSGTHHCMETKFIFDKLVGWASENSTILDRILQYANR